MKTSLNIDDTIMMRLKRESARQGRTVSELVETALRRYFRSCMSREDLPPLPKFRGGVPQVDIADGDALDNAMEER